jgi:hypothetical protein
VLAVLAGGERIARLSPSLHLILVFRTRLVDRQLPVIESCPIQGLNCRVRLGIIAHFDKRKTARNAGISVFDHSDRGNCPMGLEQFAELVFRRNEVQIADEYIFHGSAPAVQFARRVLTR